jgi:hypothetical protein
MPKLAQGDYAANNEKLRKYLRSDSTGAQSKARSQESSQINAN